MFLHLFVWKHHWSSRVTPRLYPVGWLHYCSGCGREPNALVSPHHLYSFSVESCSLHLSALQSSSDVSNLLGYRTAWHFFTRRLSWQIGDVPWQILGTIFGAWLIWWQKLAHHLKKSFCAKSHLCCWYHWQGRVWSFWQRGVSHWFCCRLYRISHWSKEFVTGLLLLTQKHSEHREDCSQAARSTDNPQKRNFYWFCDYSARFEQTSSATDVPSFLIRLK